MTNLKIAYTDSLSGITGADLQGGFFEGWPNPPSPETHFRILKNSSEVILARLEGGQVVGYITAISDGISCAYIPFLEVLPGYRGLGIGSELVRRMLEKLRHLYMVDLVCDPELRPFYERLGMRPMAAMAVRHYDRQSCTLPNPLD